MTPTGAGGRRSYPPRRVVHSFIHKLSTACAGRLMHTPSTALSTADASYSPRLTCDFATYPHIHSHLLPRHETPRGYVTSKTTSFRPEQSATAQALDLNPATYTTGGERPGGGLPDVRHCAHGRDSGHRRGVGDRPLLRFACRDLPALRRVDAPRGPDLRGRHGVARRPLRGVRARDLRTGRPVAASPVVRTDPACPVVVPVDAPGARLGRACCWGRLT